MIAWAGLFAAVAAAALPPGPGISENLANDRAGAIRNVRYNLSFQIPAKKSDPIHGAEVIRFDLRAPRSIVLDFDQPRDHLHEVRINGRTVEFALAEGHVILPLAASKAGENAVSVDFIAGNEPLNRNDDFLYTLFVPARAHLAFPCFDQPSLKARYTLTLDVPPGWQAVANGAEAARTGQRTRFSETSPLPTYLFAFAAGKFQVETAQRNGRTFRMFHRETDAAKVARNRDAIFDLHARALAWLEAYTGIPYPWGKFDFVLIPSFQFGGMEHPGAILYNAASLMLDPSATQNQFLNRASTIAHETAHMWFGDLVTMRWFNDVWMKEVMANFMAAKIVNPSFPQVNHDLRFLLEHYPAAYDVDRTPGANPIRQPLANLNEAGSLYGNIIYDKAPIVMRQLEGITGADGFRDGLRDYLKRYSFGNATWLDLVQIFEARHPGQVAAWSRAWVERRGRPEILQNPRSDGTFPGIRLLQRDPLHRGVLWPQHLDVALGYPNHIAHLPAELRGASVTVPIPPGAPRPLFVLPNGAGLGYGLFLLDPPTLRYLLAHLEDIPDPLTRGSAWIDLWENLLEARLTPAQFLDLASRALPKENDEQNTQRVLAYLAHAFWQFLPQSERLKRGPALESLLRTGLALAASSSAKSAWFNAVRDTALTPQTLAWLQRVWRREEKIAGLPLAETDEINLALELAVRDVPGAPQILATQLARTGNPDRKARLAFVIPALSADPAERQQAFDRFRQVENRRHEPWVLESLRYLNHPLRQPQALRFLQPTLELLPEIQSTGDIFFPQRWVDATLGYQRSPRAAKIVRDFLARENLPQRLQWVVLRSADNLFRATRMPNGD
jgi:aminopeptidase N